MNDALKTSKELVAAIRDLARELLRSRWISNVLQEIMKLTACISQENKVIEALNKRIAQANYNISKLDPANPSYEVLLKNENDAIEYCKKDIEISQKTNEELNKNIDGKNEDIKKIENGELLVDADNLNAKAKELIEAYYSQKVTEVL